MVKPAAKSGTNSFGFPDSGAKVDPMGLRNGLSRVPEWSLSKGEAPVRHQRGRFLDVAFYYPGSRSKLYDLVRRPTTSEHMKFTDRHPR